MPLTLGILQQQGEPSGAALGLFLTVAAVVMAAYTIGNYRNGFMYRGTQARVYRKDDPRRFKLWLGIQIFLVLVIAAFAVLSFLPYRF